MSSEQSTTGFIYLLTAPNGKKYVGQTKKRRAETRLNQHALAAAYGDPKPLYRAIRKHGWESFTREIIWTGPASELNAMEARLIVEHDSFIDDGIGYNLTRGGDGIVGAAGSVRAKISITAKARFAAMTPEHRSALGRLGAAAFMATSTAAERSARIRDRWAKVSPEDRSAKLTKTATSMTAAQRSARSKAANASRTAAERSASVRRMQAARTVDARKASTRAMNAARSSESRSATMHAVNAKARIAAAEWLRVIAPAISEARASGASTQAHIAAYLNVRGFTTIRGGHWDAQAVSRAERARVVQA